MDRSPARLIYMDHLQGYAVPATDAVRERWRRASADSVWLRPGDWYHPAVDALVEALCEERDATPAAERLGRARPAAGRASGEATDDAGGPYRAHDREPVVDLVRGVAVGWSEGYEANPVAPEVLDPESGLATTQYLVHRLRAPPAPPLPPGRDATHTHGRLGADGALDDLPGWQRFARSAAMGRALTHTFGEGHPMASIGNGLFVVLGERDADDAMVRTVLRHNIERMGLALGVTAILRRPPRVWLEPLPRTHTAAVQLLDTLQR